ncbi:MAG TPA: PHP domain-containing protein, partial [Roseiflexaceae bacterium]|nr:PHP domain-containing protein [Roseiflexaceae bacterium]
MHYIPGALHMHTTYSDGSGSVEDLARAARAAGLRWIIITDHDTLAGQQYEGWIDGVLVIIDHEITPDHNHFLALNVDEVIDNTLAPQDFVEAVYARGGFGIIAHPDERVRNDFKDIYRWDDWDVDG